MPDTTQLHTDQVEYWNGVGGARWVSNQKRTEGMISEVADIAILRAAVQPGETVIDIGCGCGGTTIEIAKLIGPTGHVIGADVSAPILAVASDRLAGYSNAKTILADAATYDFPPAAADLLFSRFGVMFFGDPTSAFANMRKALKHTGRVVFACWRPPAENPWMIAPLEATYRHVPPLPQLGPEDPSPFSFGNQERVTRILTGAGFKTPSFEAVNLTFDLAGGKGLDSAVDCALQLGPSSRALEGQPPEVRDAVAISMRELLAGYSEGDSVKMQAAIWIVSTAIA
ncbi:MAG: putative S-adenosyl-L-methionine (SAM)-dependent methyltransferase [Rhodospirillales bacterium]|nr:putative S-adenosyl-L-methionine (SAM)-dependent methyltransferase [Rhodospirillales bacterium]